MSAAPRPRVLPVPMMNIVNGGAHADNPIDFQEFMIMPVGAPTFAEGLRMGVEVFQTLKKALHDAGHNTNVGDEGGFAPEPAVGRGGAGLRHEGDREGRLQARRATSCSRSIRASTEFFKNGYYVYEGEGKTRSKEEQAKYLAELASRYPIASIEDGMAEDDFDGWKRVTDLIGKTCQLVGDDLFVTNVERLNDCIKQGIANSILVKVNQIGTLTETLAAVETAHKAGYTAVMSHRSGETEDATIADLAVATNCGQIKTGSLARSDRTAKYNQLLRIEQELGPQAKYLGRAALRALGKTAVMAGLRPSHPRPEWCPRQARGPRSVSPSASERMSSAARGRKPRRHPRFGLSMCGRPRIAQAAVEPERQRHTDARERVQRCRSCMDRARSSRVRRQTSGLAVAFEPPSLNRHRQRGCALSSNHRDGLVHSTARPGLFSRRLSP